MKKRTLFVSFLIFTLCVFHSFTPGTVLAQEDASLAQQVFDEHKDTLLRDDVKVHLPPLLNGLKGSALDIPTLINTAITLVTADPTGASLKGIAAGQGITLTDDHIALIADTDVQAVLQDDTTVALLSLKGDELAAALDEFAALIAAAGTTDPDDGTTPPDDGTTPPDDGTTPPDDGTTPPDDGTKPLAQQVFDEHKDTLLRDDVKVHLPPLLNGLKGSALDIPTLINTAITLVTADPTGASLKGIAAGQGITLTDDHIALIADTDVQAVLQDDTTVALLSLKGDELAAALDEFAALIAAATPDPGDGTTPDPGDGTTPDPGDGTTPDPGDGTTPDPGDGTTPDPGDGTTPDPGDGTTPDPGDGTTPDPGDGTTPDPGDGTTPDPGDGTTPQVGPQAPEPPSLLPDPRNGKSRLGGLSLRGVWARRFIQDLVADAGLNPNLITDANLKLLVDLVLAQVPQGFLPKKQIEYILMAENAVPIFQEEAAQLYPENFGNAIMPDLAELIYTNVPNKSKFLVSNRLNVYTRVPDALEGDKVEFGLYGPAGGQVKVGEIDPNVFQKDTILYTFRLDEALAATNLPAWPDMDGKFTPIFSDVQLRFTFAGKESPYNSIDMEYNNETGEWEREIGIKWDTKNVHYYFDVTLAKPAILEIINREALAKALQSTTGTTIEESTRTYLIEKWSMPDPRNLQFVDRGILKALFTPDVRNEIIRIAAPLLIDPTTKVSGKDLVKLRNLLLANTESLTRPFEGTFDPEKGEEGMYVGGAFDPKIASIFNIPDVDYETESLWVANIEGMADGEYTLQATVLDSDGNEIDFIQEDFVVDTTAPEADIDIAPISPNATGYLNNKKVFVATAPNANTAALLNITSSNATGVSQGDGYLVYQIIDLDENGEAEGTWLPLTVQNSMVASELWKLAKRLPKNVREIQIPGLEAPIDITAFPLDFLIGALQGDVQIPNVSDIDSVIINAIKEMTGIELSTEGQYQLFVDLIGAAVADINLIPITSTPSVPMVHPIPIQGEKMTLMLGDYGIRAMGIDKQFNVGSYVPPKILRIVNPEKDEARVAAVTVGDVNFNGKIDDYENGKIYRNTLEDVVLTVMVEKRTVHPLNRAPQHPNASILVQFLDDEGKWQEIGHLELEEGENAPAEGLTIRWENLDATVFEALLGADSADSVVQVRTVTTNALGLEHISDPFPIELDPDVHPVDPKVLIVDVDKDSIEMRSPDSGAPQGTIPLNGYAARRTVPETTSIQVEVSMDGNDWKDVGTVEVMTDPDGDNVVDGAMTADAMFKGDTLAAVYDASETHVDSTSSYIKWSLPIDTVALDLADSITNADLDAAHAASDPDMTYVELDGNRYMVRAYPVTAEGKDEAGVAEGDAFTEKFSLDNVDDVGPLGPTNVVATSIDPDNSVFMDNGDGTYTVGGLVDKYDPDVKSPVVTFTITASAKRDTYASVQFNTDLPAGAIIGDITETEPGIFTVTVDVGTLMDEDTDVHNDTYMEDAYIENPDKNIYNPMGKEFSFNVYAKAYDADMEGNMQHIQTHDRDADGQIIETVDQKITVNVQNSYRPDPGVLAIAVVNSDGMVNPDSGAPQGELTFDVYTHGITSAPTEGIRVEVKRPIDDTWERITGTAEASELVSVSEVPVADLSDIAEANAGITNVGVIGALVDISETEGTSPATLMKWSYKVDTRELALEDTVTAENTIKLDDTINRGDGASERSVDADENQYVVRAYALTPKNQDHVEYPKRDEYLERGGVETTFSLDNLDDVPPLGPTHIIDVADAAGSIEANDDGSYTVSLIVDEPALSTDVIFTIEPDSETDPKTYVNGKVRLVRADDADNKDAMNYGDLNANGQAKVTINVNDLENGAYQFHALLIDEFDNEQVQGEDDKPSPVITVHVNNISLLRDITDLTVTEVDGESPDRHELQETVEGLAGRFPLKESIAVSFIVNNGSLAVEDLTGVLVDGHEVMFTPGSDSENTFSLMASELSTLADGWYTPEGRVTKRNGSATFQLATINLDNTGPMIIVETPLEGHTVNDLPTLLAGYSDGSLGSGVSDGTGVSAEDTAVVSLARLRPEEVVQDAVSIEVNQSMVEQDLDSVVYTRTDQLAGGAYQFTVNVKDRLGNLGEQTVTFAIEGDDPTIVITAPASGQTLDASPEKITGFFAGGGDVSITKFTINGEDVTYDPPVENNFTYMPEALGDGDYTVAVEVTDGSGVTAQTALTFTVELPVPTVAITTPHAGQVYDNGMPIIAGDFSGADHTPIQIAISIDNGEPIALTGSDNNQFTHTPIDALSDGAHVVTVVVTDANGRTAETSTDFTVNIPGPSVMIHVPDAGQMYDISRPSVTGEFTGVATPVNVSLTLDGEPVEAVVNDNEFMYTPTDALDDGEYTLVAMATDDNGKTAKATAIFMVRLPVPTVAITTPHAGQVYDNGMPIIAGDFSGADPIMVALTIDEIPVTAEMNDNNQFTYTPTGALSDGEHTVSVKVTDYNGRTAETSTVFVVDIPGPTVAILSPAAGQEYEHGKPIVRGEFGGETDVEFSLTLNGEAVQATVVDNKFEYTPDPFLDDGEYTLVAMTTDANGKTSEATVIFSIRLPVPTVAITTPYAGQIYDNGMPVIMGTFSGANPVVVALTIDGNAVEATVNDNNEFTYTPTDALSHGEHTIAVEVTDGNGRTAETSSVFTVDIPGPSVAIHSPSPGQTFDHGKPMLQGEFSGVDASVAVTVNDQAIPVVVDGNEFTFTPPVSIGDGEYSVVAVATDANGKTAKATVVFSVSLPVPTVAILTPTAGQTIDHGMPVITGNFSGADEIVVALTIDGNAVEATVNDNNEFTYTPADALSHGEHTIAVVVTDGNGRTAETSSVFTVDIPGPSVAIHSPSPGQTFDHGMPMLQGEFSGVDATVAVTVNDQAIPVVVDGNEFTFTPPVSIGDGEYSVVAVVTDANGKTAKATVVFSVSLPVPTVAILSPTAGEILDHGKPVISGNFSGADEIVVALTIDGNAVEATVNDNNEFTYTPTDALSHGEHTIAVEVTDGNSRTAETSSVFTVDIPGPSVAIHSPAPGQLFDHGKPMLQGEFSGVDPELTVMVNDEEIEVVVDGNKFTFTPADGLDDGEYTVVAEVEDANGKTAKATAVFSVRLPEPTVTIKSPAAGLTYDNGSPVIAGEFTGVAPVEVKLSINGEDAEVKVDGNQFTHDLADALAHGDHTISVEVTDANGKTAQATTVFTVDIPGPSVSILSPASGQTYDHGTPVIRAEFMGSTDVNVTTFTINGEDADAEVEDNQLTYTPDPALGDGEHTVVVEVTDANKKTAEASVVFSVMRDKTAPVITAYSPTGVVRLNKADVADEDMGITISADISDPESDLLSVKYLINDTAPTHSYPVDNAGNKFEVTHSFNAGTHSITLIAASEGGSKEFRWTFTVEVDQAPPAISNITPAGTVQAGLPTISASATDDTGVEEMSITLMDSEGKEVKGNSSDDDEDRANEGITRLDFNPDAPLEEGTYTISVRATDGYGNSSTAKGGFTVTFDTAAPIITMASPQNGSRLTYKHDEERKPNISIAYSDAGTGINVDSIRFVLNDNLINLTSKQKSASQVNYTPPADLDPGKYVVKLEVSDNAHQQGNVSEKNKGAREANTAVYEFSFFVERGDTPIMWAAPFNYPNPFNKNTRISLVLARRANVSITIFDSTLRPVRVLVDNEVMDAGNYTKNPAGAGSNAIGWDGKSSSGEDLARGIYFCQIEVNDGIEPEFAILKLALTR